MNKTLNEKVVDDIRTGPKPTSYPNEPRASSTSYGGFETLKLNKYQMRRTSNTLGLLEFFQGTSVTMILFTVVVCMASSLRSCLQTITTR